MLEAARAAAPRGVPNGAQRNVAIIAVGVYTGLRVSELVGLDRADVDLDELLLRVRHGKGDKDREIPLHRRAAAELERYLSARDDSNPAVFLARGGRRLSARAVHDLVVAVAKRAGVTKRISPHKLRHTFATSFLDHNPGDIRVLQELLGHVRLDTTEIYTHVSHPRRRQDVDRIP